MRVLHVFKDAYPPVHGGIEQHVHDIVESVEGVAFTVLAGSRSRRRVEEAIDGVRMIRLPELIRLGSAPVMPSLAREIRAAAADVVHLHVPNPAAEVACLRARPPGLVVTYHADNPRSSTTHAGSALRRTLGPASDAIQRRLLGRARRIIVTSPAMAARPSLAVLRDRTTVIPFGIDAAAWRDRPPEADAVRARYPGPLVLFLGRLVHYKGLDVLLEAMHGLDATLLIAGDGPMRRRLPATDAVIHLGEVPDDERAALYHAADVFVLPSTSAAETFGIAMLEAMACGTPAVCTEVGTGTSWVNVHGSTGLVVPPRDVRSLAGALGRLLAEPSLRAAMGSAAQRRAGTAFTKQAMVSALAAVYRSVGERP